MQDDVVHSAADYEHTDVLSLWKLTQIEEMLDILYNNFVNVDDDGKSSVSTAIEVRCNAVSLSRFLLCSTRTCSSD